LIEVALLESLKWHKSPFVNLILDSFVYRQHLCIVFELLDKNLYQILKGRKFKGLPLVVVRDIAYQTLEALDALQSYNIIHCDLKPENIVTTSPEGTMMAVDVPPFYHDSANWTLSHRRRAASNFQEASTTTEGRRPSYDHFHSSSISTHPHTFIKLIDFGSACFSDQLAFSYIQSRFYRAPEILLGLPYTSAIDMWGLGCICAELFTGLPIFPGSSEVDQMRRISTILGTPPSWMLDHGKYTSKFFAFVSSSLSPADPSNTLRSQRSDQSSKLSLNHAKTFDVSKGISDLGITSENETMRASLREGETECNSRSSSDAEWGLIVDADCCNRRTGRLWSVGSGGQSLASGDQSVGSAVHWNRRISSIEDGSFLLPESITSATKRRSQRDEGSKLSSLQSSPSTSPSPPVPSGVTSGGWTLLEPLKRENSSSPTNDFRLDPAPSSPDGIRRRGSRLGCLDDLLYTVPIPGNVDETFRQEEEYIRKEFISFLKILLTTDPRKRCTARQAMSHPFLTVCRRWALRDADRVPNDHDAVDYVKARSLSLSSSAGSNVPCLVADGRRANVSLATCSQSDPKDTFRRRSTATSSFKALGRTGTVDQPAPRSWYRQRRRRPPHDTTDNISPSVKPLGGSTFPTQSARISFAPNVPAKSSGLLGVGSSHSGHAGGCCLGCQCDRHFFGGRNFRGKQNETLSPYMGFASPLERPRQPDIRDNSPVLESLPPSMKGHQGRRNKRNHRRRADWIR